MANKYPVALSPIRIGNTVLKNRIVSAPSTMHSMSNGELYPSQDALAFFEERARAGVGMVTVAGLKVGKDVRDDGAMTAWDVNAPNHRNKLMELVERIHFYGAKALMMGSLAEVVPRAMILLAPAAFRIWMAARPMGPVPETTTLSPNLKREERMPWRETQITSKSTASLKSTPSGTGTIMVWATSLTSRYSA